MRWWFKCDTDFWGNPKVMTAGLHAGAVFQAVRGLMEEHDRDGELSKAESHPDVIYRRVSGVMTRPQFKKGFESAIREKLLGINGALVTIPGWSKAWKSPLTDRERKQRERTKKSGRDVTESHGSVRDVGHGMSLPEERRGEESTACSLREGSSDAHAREAPPPSDAEARQAAEWAELCRISRAKAAAAGNGAEAAAIVPGPVFGEHVP